MYKIWFIKITKIWLFFFFLFQALVLKGGKFAVTVLKISPSQNHLAVGYADGGINVFDLDNGQVLFQFNGHKSPVTVLNYNKDGFILVSGGKVSKIQNLYFFYLFFWIFQFFLGYGKLQL